MPSNYGLDHFGNPNPYHVPRASEDVPGFSQECFSDMKTYVMHGREEARVHRNCALYKNPEKKANCLAYGAAIQEHHTDLYHNLLTSCGKEFRKEDPRPV